MSDSNRLVFQCSCGTELAVPVSAAGKKTKCPNCAEILVIPASQNQPPAGKPQRPRVSAAVPPRQHARPEATRPQHASAPKPPVEDDPGYDVQQDAGYGVAFEKAIEEDSAPASAAPQSSCPNCAQLIPATSVVCVACGYDSRTGRILKTKIRKELKVGEVAAVTGKFILGIVLSGVGALVGMIVWCLLILFTGFEIGWIAWGIGLASGFGMYLGYRSQDALAGLIAAVIALAGIMSAKGIIFMLIQAAAAAEGQPGIRFGELFGILDIVFFFLAGATAFRIAGGGTSNEEA